MVGQSNITRQIVADGCEPTALTPAPMDHLRDAQREAACIGLDLGDAIRAKRDRRARRQHISDALGRAHQLIHMLKAAEHEAESRVA